MCAEIEALLDDPIPPTHDETAASDYYKPSLDDADLNLNPTTPITSTYPLQLSLSPMHNPTYRDMYGVEIFYGTTPFAFTVAHIG